MCYQFATKDLTLDTIDTTHDILTRWFGAAEPQRFCVRICWCARDLPTPPKPLLDLFSKSKISTRPSPGDRFLFFLLLSKQTLKRNTNSRTAGREERVDSRTFGNILRILPIQQNSGNQETRQDRTDPPIQPFPGQETGVVNLSVLCSSTTAHSRALNRVEEAFSRMNSLTKICAHKQYLSTSQEGRDKLRVT
jgi:hypothetical protein